VTGSNTGIGKDVARILYSKNAKVYLMTRSQVKADRAMEEIRKATPNSKGSMVFIQLDLSDLSTVKTSAQKFLDAETRLDVLFNNAGVMNVADKATFTTPQGFESHVGVNCLGTFLLTQLLTPCLIETVRTDKSKARGEPEPVAPRVVWVSSTIDVAAVRDTAVDADHFNDFTDRDQMHKYGNSKAGNWLQSVEYARRHQDDGIVSVAVNPGNLGTELYRQHGWFATKLIGMITYPPVNGAYSELFAGLSPEILLQNTGCWGKFIHTIFSCSLIQPS